MSQRTTIAATVSLLAIAGSRSAFAQDVLDNSGPPYSIDIEFVRPTLGHGSLIGVDVPMTKRQGTFRYALYSQYEQNPLTLYDAVADTELGFVVHRRVAFHTGLSYDLSERVTLGAVMPAAYQWDSQTAEFAADGLGAGDLTANGRVIIVKTRRDVFNMGVRAAVAFPTGRQNAYIGEDSIRVGAGLLAATNLGPLRLATDVGVITRETDNTGEDFVASTELTWNNGATFFLPAATRTAITGQVLSRAGFSNFLAGGAENALEAVGGLQFYPSQYTTIDLGAGRGLTEGYGTTDLRVLGGLIVEIAPKQRVVLPAPPPPPPPLPPEPPPAEVIIDDPPVVEETEVLTVFEDRIELKQQIEFIVDTNTVQEYSYPILDGIAEILNSKANIGHVAIIGHASQEGSVEYNYRLSESRARAIWEKLVERGVAVERISYQGAGEVRPLKGFEDESEESLQKNRRTEFQITQWFSTPEEMPDYPDQQLVPWTGATVTVIQPPKPEPEPTEAEKEVKLDEYGMPVDDEEFEMDLGKPPGGGEE